MIEVVISQDRTVGFSGKTRRNSAKVKTIALIVAVLGAIWFAPSPAAAQVIHACAHKRTGILRVATNCKSTETQLSWNIQGPQGPPGNLNPVANVQQLNVVDSGNNVLATLGTSSFGHGLTFFDSSGNVTLILGNTADGTAAGLALFDGNNIIPGTGKFRLSLAEANASNAFGNGFGLVTWDTAEKAKLAAVTTLDNTQSFIETIDPNGSVAAIEDDGKTFHQQGFFTNDLNGKNRTFVGNSLDGTSYDEIITNDPNGSFAGIEDNNGGTGGQGFFSTDKNGNNRIFAGTSLDGTSFNVIDTTDSNGSQAGITDNTGSGGSQGFFANDTQRKQSCFRRKFAGWTRLTTGSLCLTNKVTRSLESSDSIRRLQGRFLLEWDCLSIESERHFFCLGEILDGKGVNWTLLDTSSVIRGFG